MKMNNFKINTNEKYNLFELTGRTDRITVCAWNCVDIEENVHNSSKVNLDTKFYFDHKDDKDALNIISEHYDVNKYYTPAYESENMCYQVLVIPASIYTAKGMKNGYWIITNSYNINSYILINGIYEYDLFDNPSDAARYALIKQYEDRENKIEMLNRSEDITILINNKRIELERKLEDDLKKYENELRQQEIINNEVIQYCKSFAKRTRRIAEALKIDLTKYKQLFDYG